MGSEMCIRDSYRASWRLSSRIATTSIVVSHAFALVSDLRERAGVRLAQRAGLRKWSGSERTGSRKWSGSKRTGLRKRSGPDMGRPLTMRIQLLHNKLGDALSGVRGRPEGPEQLYGSLHQLDLRDVFRLIKAQESDYIFVRYWSFHRSLSHLPE